MPKGTGVKSRMVRRLREETGCSMMDAASAFDLREGNYTFMKEYVERRGLAVSYRGTPAQQQAMRYPKWSRGEGHCEDNWLCEICRPCSCACGPCTRMPMADTRPKR